MDRKFQGFTRVVAAAAFAWLSLGSPGTQARPQAEPQAEWRLAPPDDSQAAAPHADDAEGEKVVADLRARYADTTADCGSPTLPAVLCSGVLLRATRYLERALYDPWVPNPNNPKGVGISFSLLRADAKFEKLAHSASNGFIVYAPRTTPPTLFNLEVLCIFPIDAATDARTGSGCGAHRSFPDTSGPCATQGIDTVDLWLAHYHEYEKYTSHDHQCGFDTSIGARGTAAAYMTAIKAMGGLGQESFEEQNELIVTSWADKPNKIGIEAFFYVSEAGKLEAQKTQKLFEEKVGVWRPVIKMVLPCSLDQDVTFGYAPADQVR